MKIEWTYTSSQPIGLLGLEMENSNCIISFYSSDFHKAQKKQTLSQPYYSHSDKEIEQTRKRI